MLMEQYSENVYTEKMSRRERARIANVQTVLGHLTGQQCVEAPDGLQPTALTDQPAQPVHSRDDVPHTGLNNNVEY